MNITILSVDIKTVPTAKGSYQTAEVAYKNNTFQGKVEGKKVMSFGATAASFKVLTTAQQGDTFNIEVVKNAAGYNDWVSMTKAGVESAAPSQGAASSPAKSSVSTPKSTYETPEERAAKQVYIIRQSSIASAVNMLGFGAKAPLKAADVVATAKELEAFVLGKGPTGFDDLPDFDELPKVE